MGQPKSIIAIPIYEIDETDITHGPTHGPTHVDVDVDDDDDDETAPPPPPNATHRPAGHTPNQHPNAPTQPARGSHTTHFNDH